MTPGPRAQVVHVGIAEIAPSPSIALAFEWVGSWCLHRSIDDQPVVTRADLDKTIMLDKSKQSGVKENAEQSPAAKEKIGVLTSLDDSGLGEIDLTKKLTRLGKSDNSEIRLSGMLIPPTAATISKRPNGYTITFTGGNAKLKVNGEVIHESITLKDFDTIEIGSHKFQFYQKDLN